MLKVLLIGLSCLLTFSVCFPSNFKYGERTFRSISFEYDPDTIANRSYAFDYRLKDGVQGSGTVLVFRPYPNDTFGNLRINEELEMRAASVIKGVTVKEGDYSSWRIIKVRPSSEVGDVMTPGPVLSLKVVDSLNNTTKSAIVNWNDPQNVQDATTDNDKDIQYMVETCKNNKFTGENTECKLIANVLKIKGQIQQTTDQAPKFYNFDFKPVKKNEIAYKVTPLSLNGTKGPSVQVVKRLDESEKPATPSNFTSSEVFADELKLSWEQGSGVNMNYIKYNIKLNSTTTMKMSSTSFMTITGLESETEYEFQVGAYSSMYGGSEWSAKYTVKTTNATRPVTPSAGNSLTSSMLLLVSMFAFGLLKLV